MFGLSSRFMPRVCRICKSESTAKVSKDQIFLDLLLRIDVLFNRADRLCAVVDAKECGIVALNINAKTSIIIKISPQIYFFVQNFSLITKNHSV